MKKIDSLTLRLFQLIADWYQEWFGGDNFLLSKTSMVISWVFILIDVNVTMSNKANFSNQIFTIVMMAIFTLVMVRFIAWGERSCRNNPRFKNPCEVRLYLLRVFQFFFIGPLSINLIIFYFWNVDVLFPNEALAVFGKLTRDKTVTSYAMEISYEFFLMAFLYFGSCTPKPPKEGRLSKLLEKLMPQPAGA